MNEILEVIRDFVLPIVTLVLGLWGWRANADKKKLKAEIEGLEASNTEKDIENQSSWLELYKKLHDDMAQRMVSMEKEINNLKKTNKFLENAFKKIHDCLYVGICPVANELQKHETTNRKRTNKRPTTNRQREPSDRKEGDTTDSSTGEGDDEPEHG